MYVCIYTNYFQKDLFDSNTEPSQVLYFRLEWTREIWQ